MAKKRQRLRIICVSRGPELPQRIKAVLRPRRPDVTFEPDMDRVLERFEEEQFDILVMSSAAVKGGRIDGVDLIEVITAKSPRTQILFVADDHAIRAAMTALKAGSYHYAKLPVSDEELRLLIETALEQRQTYGPNLLLHSERRRAGFQDMVGRSPAMQAVYRQIRQAAATDMPILITGETGTGKDLAAHAIHQTSARRDGPFLPVNLAALPRELVASELFGHEKGSFTGAAAARAGLFERGNGGTVFLDEIGSIDEKVQVSLLRLIEQKRFHRLGGRAWLTTDARLIAASNVNLSEAVRNGSFREDLFYRLDVFHIDMPRLTDRRGDVTMLVDAFLKRYSDAFQREIRGLAPECLAIFDQYDWPGNVRELKNVVQRAVLVCTDNIITPAHLPDRLVPAAHSAPNITFDIGTPLRDVERDMIAQTLIFTGNNRKQTAELLGISRRALYNKLRRYGL
ncbi:MAG: sigma-54-dependent Fis family transcriptional regulator [Lentisphaerae bacterium]|nr:sigma-54-dependent Fis family transcriptional regulator [Lentisphaerota bacterium]